MSPSVKSLRSLSTATPKGTFTRPVTAAFIAAIIVQFLVQGKTSAAVPYYGVGVFLPITAMGLAIRQHILHNFTGRARQWGSLGAGLAAGMGALIFIGQIVGKWSEGGWMVLIVLTALVLIAHAILLSPSGYRDSRDINRIIHDKSRVEGAMGEMVAWQSQRTQEYRYTLLVKIAQFAELFGVRRPVRYEAPAPVGSYEAAMQKAPAAAHSLEQDYAANQPKPEPLLGGKPTETGAPDTDNSEGLG